MTDVRVVALAARQFNRFARHQLAALGINEKAIEHRLDTGEWVQVHDAVYAIAPPLDDEHSRWMAATLTERGSVLSHASAAAAWGWWDRPRVVEIVTRPGSGGPRRLDGVLVHRSQRLSEDTTTRFGIPITDVPRTLLDLAPHVGMSLLARCLREAVRLQTTSVAEIVDVLSTRHRGRRGARKLALTAARYAGLPLERARSGSEVRALEILRDAGRPMPILNLKVAGREADLVWREERLIVEIDGAPWHLDRGEDARREQIWQRAGFTVLRVPAEALRDPLALLSVAPNVREPRL